MCRDGEGNVEEGERPARTAHGRVRRLHALKRKIALPLHRTRKILGL